MGESRSSAIGVVTIGILCLFGSLALLSFWILDFLNAQGAAIPRFGVTIGRDFANLWIGGRDVWDQHLGSLYDLDDYLAFMRGYFPHQTQHNYSYPPHSLFFGAIFGALPYLPAYGLWVASNAAFFLYAARPYVRSFPLVLAILTPGALTNIWDGQYGFLIGGLWLLMFSRLERKPRQAGLLAGLLTIKPHLGLLLPFILLEQKRYRAILFAALTTLALLALSGMVVGFGLWRDYLVKAPVAQAQILMTSDENIYFRMMPTTLVAFRGYPAGIAAGAQIITALFALSLLWRARGAKPRELAFISATATFLILPYAFNYDMTVLCLGLIVLMADRWTALATWERFFLSMGVMLPTLIFAANLYGIPLAPALLCPCLAIQLRNSSAAPRRHARLSMPRAYRIAAKQRSLARRSGKALIRLSEAGRNVRRRPS
ncbi:glycosyltransferase family 87 protein [Sphingobium sp. H39-3-25]|uniref:glycosyltransferase family 87 protein n=1 Tax=Sphingobium arseniciresistens TaxID=3030834 RepID=UPI0023BA22D0|nr:glycosyltransferase family 87 protein [Sphingobium arseniciresistens]